MRLQTIHLFVSLLLLTLLLSGCSGNVKVRGTVQFDDGTPLDGGTIIFTDGKAEYLGRIGTDGRYSLGVLKDGSGIPPGTYRVCVRGMERQTGRVENKRFSGDTGPYFLEVPEMYDIADKKFTDASTSGLSVTVPSGEYSFKVGERLPIPPPNPRARYVESATPSQ